MANQYKRLRQHEVSTIYLKSLKGVFGVGKIDLAQCFINK